MTALYCMQAFFGLIVLVECDTSVEEQQWSYNSSKGEISYYSPTYSRSYCLSGRQMYKTFAPRDVACERNNIKNLGLRRKFTFEYGEISHNFNGMKMYFAPHFGMYVAFLSKEVGQVHVQ